MQTVNVDSPRDSGFIYDPKWKELRIVSGISLVLNRKTMRFDIDRTPSADAELVPVQDMSIAPDATRMSFRAEYAGEQIQFNVASRHRVDHVLYAAVRRIQAQSFSFDARDEDNVSLLCKNGSPYSFVARKSHDPSGPYLHLSFDDAGMFRIIENPHARVPASNLQCRGGNLTVETETENPVYRFHSQEIIVNLIEDLLACTSRRGN